MCSALSLRKQVSTCSAEQSQRLLLGRLRSDFHNVIHFLTAQTGVFRARALHKHEKREISEELEWKLLLGKWPRLTLRVGWKIWWVLLSTCSLVEGYGQPSTVAIQGHTTIPLLLCCLPLAAFFFTFWSSRAEAGNCANDTHQLIEAMQGTPNSKYAA